MDVVKRYIYLEHSQFGTYFGKGVQVSFESKNWIQWFAAISPAICTYCLTHHGHIFAADDPDLIRPLVHENCHCSVCPLKAFVAGTITEMGRDGVDLYLFLHHCLPENYLTQDEAKMRGWESWRGNLDQVLPGVVIGGSIYKNRDGRLPSQPGRIWYEVDFDYNGGYRNHKRILFSSDGLVFVTFDHYLSFSEVVWGAINLKTYTIDLSSVRTLYELHLYLKKLFALPDYYGMNMDALWDCLHCSFEEPTLIEIKNMERTPNSLKEPIRILRELFQDLEREDPEVEISCF